jgi:hypothetical protein
MISKKRRHKGLLKSAPPKTGRAAFRGILHPLILGGQSIAPSTNTATPNFDPYSTATVTKPDTDPGDAARIKAPCVMSAAEEEWCNIDPTFSWCQKQMLFADDPKCTPNNIRCPVSQKWLEIMNDPNNCYRDFLKEEHIINGIDGQCVDEAITENEARGKKAYDDWIETRGCKLSYNNFGHEVQQNYARCPEEFKTANLGDIRSVDREDQSGNTQDFFMRLMQWLPDKPSFVSCTQKS